MAGLDEGICKFSSPTRIGLQPVNPLVRCCRPVVVFRWVGKHYRYFLHLNDAALSVLTLGTLLCRSPY
jgi:hypothetical protein